MPDDGIIIDPSEPIRSDEVLSIRKPSEEHYLRRTANLHYASEFHEIGTIAIRPTSTMEDVMRQYCSLFPKEAAQLMKQISSDNHNLHAASGMSDGKSMMAAGSIPEVIMEAAKFIYGPHYWDDKKNTLNFLNQYPKLKYGEARKGRGAGNIGA